ncbi:MAG: hypothetical protein JWM86_2226 [Thermoleophilia bacterium]|nr:hypothetical protein [Thermoleophilia bacterium]
MRIASPTNALRRRRVTARALLLLALWALALGAPSTSHAADYWVSLSSARGEIAPGVNGFTLHASGGPFNAYANHCQADPGSYVAGAYCKLRFNVPAGLTAGAVGNGGIARGDFRTANDFAILRSERPGGNPAGVTDSPGDGAFNHGWQVLGPYVEIGLRCNGASTATSASNWFHINSFDVLLHDPSAPTISHVVAGSGGWNGPGCLGHSYAWSDSGSQVASMALVNVSTGATVDGWASSTNGPTTGYGTAVDTGCIPAPGTGTYAFRTIATDRAGNGATHDFSVAFDTTAPTAGAPSLGGAALEDGAVIGASHGYRPAITWPGVGDAHSGLSSIRTLVDGADVAHARTGDVVRLAPTSHLSLGQHVVQLVVRDAVGNQTVVARTIVVRDEVAPTITVASPNASGGSEPVLDVSAADDHAGLAPTSWTVKVNGATLVASSTGARLQANVGFLVDGTHQIEVSIADQAGNVARQVIEYHADSGDGLPDAPGMTGLFVFSSPDVVEEGSGYHVRGIAVRDGRPVTGRVELRTGPLAIASQQVAASGAFDLDATIAVAGPLLLYPPAGSGLDVVELRYVFHPKVVDPCAATPRPASCDPAPIRCDPPLVLEAGTCRQPVGGGTGTGTGGTGGTGGSGSGSGASGGAGSGAGGSTGGSGATGSGGSGAAGSGLPGGAGAPGMNGDGSYPRNVVYYVGNVPYWNGVPLAESGAPLDKVAPSWRMAIVQRPAGTVRRTRRIAFRLWSSEMAVMSFSPTGSVTRTTISPRRQSRTMLVAIAPSSRLGRTLARARRGSLVTVRVRVIATDKNENRSFPRVVTFRVRV